MNLLPKEGANRSKRGKKVTAHDLHCEMVGAREKDRNHQIHPWTDFPHSRMRVAGRG
ncbi:MAG: hypothetical protein OXG56_12525 [Gammaproteobacteria bacterium]|nr:hypothetical protein [Gammaproteobacteria bacterium]